MREIEKLGAPNGTPREIAKVKECGLIEFADKTETLAKTIENHRGTLVLPKAS
jgi:hypothetical protein